MILTLVSQQYIYNSSFKDLHSLTMQCNFPNISLNHLRSSHSSFLLPAWQLKRILMTAKVGERFTTGASSWFLELFPRMTNTLRFIRTLAAGSVVQSQLLQSVPHVASKMLWCLLGVMITGIERSVVALPHLRKVWNIHFSENLQVQWTSWCIVCML